MKQFRRVFCFIIGLLMFSTGDFALAASADPDFITMVGGPTGGVYSVAMTGIATLLHKEFPNSIIDIQPGGSGPNLVRGAKKDLTFGVTSANNAYDAWYGRDPATPDKPIRNARAIAALFPSACQLWVLKNSQIKTFEEAIQHRFSTGTPGQTSWQPFETLLKIHGKTWKDVESKRQNLNWSQSVSALDLKQIDALFWLTTYPHSSIMEIEQANPTRLVGFSKETIKKMQASTGGFLPVTIKAGTYKANDTDIETVQTVTYLFTTDDMPDDVVYRTTKAVCEGMGSLSSVHSIMKYMTKDTIAKGMCIPLHPGAIKYYKEAGIKMDAPTVQQ